MFTFECLPSTKVFNKPRLWEEKHFEIHWKLTRVLDYQEHLLESLSEIVLCKTICASPPWWAASSNCRHHHHHHQRRRRRNWNCLNGQKESLPRKKHPFFWVTAYITPSPLHAIRAKSSLLKKCQNQINLDRPTYTHLGNAQKKGCFW